MAELARAHADIGQAEEGWRYIGETMTMIETSKQRWCEAEANRVAGEIALQSSEPDTAKADSSVRSSSHGTLLHRSYSRKGSEVIQYSRRRRGSSIPR
jgi:hypothetical protein